MLENFWINKKITVTGGNGFIGSHFVEELLNLGAYVVTISRSRANQEIIGDKKYKNYVVHKQFDIKDYKKLLRATKGCDVIINCAVLEGNVESKITKPAEILDTNMRMISNVLNCAIENNIMTVVQMSSAEIYSPRVKKLTEEGDFRKIFDYTENGYLASKIYSEYLGRLFAKQYGLKIFFPRLTNVYGPGDRPRNGLRVIPNMIKSILNNKPIEIWGDGDQKRTFIYVKDAIREVLSMVKVDKYRTLNIATKKPISVFELATLIKSITNSKATIEVDKNKPGGPRRRVLIANKLYSTKVRKHVGLMNGLRETIDWHKKAHLKLNEKEA